MEPLHQGNSCLLLSDACVRGFSRSWVYNWLSKVSLADRYAIVFESNGFDNPLVCSNLEESDLDSMGIKLAGHRKTLLLLAKRTDPNLVDENHHNNTNFDGSSTPASPNADHSSDVTISHSSVLPRRKEPILGHLERHLEGLNYWTRAKARVTPWDHDLPVLTNGAQGKLRIMLVRHAQSQANVDMSLYTRMADHVIPLSQEGEKQAIATGEEIARYYRRLYGQPDSPASTPPLGHFCRIWTSSYLRARQTSEIIKNHSGGYVTDIRENILLVEQQFGLFEGTDWYSGTLDDEYPNELKFYQKAAAFGGRFWAQVPLGESRFQVCQRVYLSFGTLHRDALRHGVNNVIIVSHGVTLRAFMAMWLHLTPEWFEEEPNPPNCSIRIIDDCVDKGYIWPRPNANDSRHNEKHEPRAEHLLHPSPAKSAPPAPHNIATNEAHSQPPSNTADSTSSSSAVAETQSHTIAAPPPCDDPHAEGSDLLLRNSQCIPKS